jgi:RHS repeat-associated protein
MEKDDEVKGVNNSYDFGARMYDNRLGRWLSIDKMTIKYPGISPYNFSYNNPLLFNDPNGNDSRITITKNENGGGNITVETTVFMYGPSASEAFAVETNEAFKQMNKGYEYIDENGNSWNVEIKMNFVYEEKLNKVASDLGKPKDGSLADSDFSTVEGKATLSEIKFEEGDNFMLIDHSLELTDTEGNPAGDLTPVGGTRSVVSWNAPSVNVHSAFHELGFVDTYPIPEFSGDIMHFLGSEILDIHYIDIAEYTLDIINDKSNYHSSFEFDKGHISMSNDCFESQGNCETSKAAKVEHKATKEAEQTERKAEKK